MPSPYPQYQPEFTPEELAKAQQVIRQHNAPHALVVRAKMVLILSEAPKIGNAALADEAGVHYNQVHQTALCLCYHDFYRKIRHRPYHPLLHSWIMRY